MVRGRSSGDQGSVGSASVWGHRRHIRQGGVHSPEGCVCFGVRELVIQGVQGLATPAVLASVQMLGAMQDSGAPPGLGQNTPELGPH